MKVAFTFLLLYFGAAGAQAYNPENHSLITQRAVTLLNKELGEDYITEAERDALIRGNVSEDEGFFKGFIRPWNQHFYNPLKPRALWHREFSTDVRFERIAKRCIANAHSPMFFFFVGEVLHHLQDATNPAHVVPVYHGPGKKDKFDEQVIECYLPTTLALNPAADFAAPYAPSILNPVALQTLAYIQSPFVVQVKHGNVASNETVNWSYFWKDNPNGWFGSYGFLGKHRFTLKTHTDNYLAERIEKSDAVYRVSEATYHDFTSRQLELAVRHTANFIHYAKRLAKQK